MAVRVVDGIMKPGNQKHQKSAVRMIEEAIHLLRSAPGSLLAGYYLGSAPFVLALMYFAVDMSRSAKAGWRQTHRRSRSPQPGIFASNGSPLAKCSKSSARASADG